MRSLSMNQFLKKYAQILKRHNRVFILSSKHTYQPMRTRVVAQLFYNTQLKTVLYEFNLFAYATRKLTERTRCVLSLICYCARSMQFYMILFTIFSIDDQVSKQKKNKLENGKAISVFSLASLPKETFDLI